MARSVSSRRLVAGEIANLEDFGGPDVPHLFQGRLLDIVDVQDGTGGAVAAGCVAVRAGAAPDSGPAVPVGLSGFALLPVLPPPLLVPIGFPTTSGR